jgi:hypothetical protein
MHPSERTFDMVKGKIALNDVRIHHMGVKLMPAKSPCEISARIVARFYINYKCAAKIRFDEFHSIRLVKYSYTRDNPKIP